MGIQGSGSEARSVQSDNSAIALNAKVSLVRTNRGYLISVETEIGDKYETPISYVLACEMREESGLPVVLRS